MKKGWEIKTLADICTFENGDRGVNYPSKAKRTSTGIPFINAGHFVDNKIDFTNMDYISRERYNLMGSGKIQKGDILFCLRGSLGKFASVENLPEGQIASSLVIVRPSELVSHEYLLAYFESYLCEENIERYRGGAAQPNLSAKSLTQFTIPIPPLPEQQRIVSVLDEAFASIAQAKSNAERNLVNARELFESYLKGVFETKSDDWEEKKLGDIGKVSMCKRVYKEQTTTTGDIPFYKIGTFGKEPDVFIPKSLYDEFRNKFSFPKKGDILISAAGTIGRRVKYDGEPAYFQDSNIVWIDNDEKQVLNDYLYQFYGACNWNSTTGATIPRLYNDNLRQIEIAFPKSLAEQRAIVGRLEALSAETGRLEEIYQQKVESLEELKKSVLGKAFAGEL